MPFLFSCFVCHSIVGTSHSCLNCDLTYQNKNVIKFNFYFSEERCVVACILPATVKTVTALCFYVSSLIWVTEETRVSVRKPLFDYINILFFPVT